jgi:hypothetical protein
MFNIWRRRKMNQPPKPLTEAEKRRSEEEMMEYYANVEQSEEYSLWYQEKKRRDNKLKRKAFEKGISIQYHWVNDDGTLTFNGEYELPLALRQKKWEEFKWWLEKIIVPLLR